MNIQLGNVVVGDGCPCYIVAEFGINHNGSVETAERMIVAAADAGAQAVKLQMRDVETVYSRDPYPQGYLSRLRKHPFGGEQTNRGQKLALEFSTVQHGHLAVRAMHRGLDYIVSAWDELSLSRAVKLPGVPWLKVASPCVTDGPLMRAHGATGLPLVISTGGLDEGNLYEVLCGIGRPKLIHECVLLHCCSAYPSEDLDLNLSVIPAMRRWFQTLVGYSGHERGIATTVAAVALGACVVERHLTLDRTMYGSDQAASLEPGAFAHMVRDIRAVEAALGDGKKRAQESEGPALAKLRRVVA